MIFKDRMLLEMIKRSKENNRQDTIIRYKKKENNEGCVKKNILKEEKSCQQEELS